jgi:hypothetical protein
MFVYSIIRFCDGTFYRRGPLSPPEEVGDFQPEWKACNSIREKLPLQGVHRNDLNYGSDMSGTIWSRFYGISIHLQPMECLQQTKKSRVTPHA